VQLEILVPEPQAHADSVYMLLVGDLQRVFEDLVEP